MTARVDSTVRELVENGADALWVEPSTNFTYLFGFGLLSLERLCGVVVTATGELRALVPLMHAEEFEGVGGIELFTWTDGTGPGMPPHRVLRASRPCWFHTRCRHGHS